MSDIDSVRLKVADRPTLRRDEWEADGVMADLRLGYAPLLETPAPRVWKDNSLQTETTHYTIDYSNGVVSIVSLPAAGAKFVFEYTSVFYSDDEVQDFLDQASGNVTLASAYLLFSWAADAARLARKESLAGGSGYGSVSITTDMRSRELRESAKAYLDTYNKLEGAGAPVEMLTEVAWTEEGAKQMIRNNLLDQL